MNNQNTRMVFLYEMKFSNLCLTGYWKHIW